MQEQVAAPPARVGVAGAMQHAQCGINAGSFSAPQPDPPRARAPESASPSAGEGAKKNLRVTRVSQRARSSRTDVRIAS